MSVTFDGRRGYIASAPELRQPIVALSLDGLRRGSRSRCYPMISMWGCSSTASPSANATAAGRSRSWRAEPGIRACTHKIAMVTAT